MTRYFSGQRNEMVRLLDRGVVAQQGCSHMSSGRHSCGLLLWCFLSLTFSWTTATANVSWTRLSWTLLLPKSDLGKRRALFLVWKIRPKLNGGGIFKSIFFAGYSDCKEGLNGVAELDSCTWYTISTAVVCFTAIMEISPIQILKNWLLLHAGNYGESKWVLLNVFIRGLYRGHVYFLW